jgi:glucosamine-6-phosphate deaminase
MPNEELDSILSIPADELPRRSKVGLEVLTDPEALYDHLARSIADEIAAGSAAGQPVRLILPVGPVDHYPRLVDICNRERISWRHVHAFHMDDYLDWQGRPLPLDHPLSFEGFMRRTVYDRLDPALRIPEDQIGFPDPRRLDRIPAMAASATMATWPSTNRRFRAGTSSRRASSAPRSHASWPWPPKPS